MSRSKYRSYGLNVWPAFTDTMLAFVLVLILFIVFQVGRSVQIIEVELSVIERRQDQEKVTRLVNELQNQYQDIEIFQDGNIQNIRLGALALFNSGSAILNQQGQTILKEIAQTILQYDIDSLREIQVNGHTDNVPIIRSTNWDLSTERALRVVKFLVDTGIDPMKINLSATGYGEFNPIASNDSSAGRSRNRRIEMRFVYTDLIR